jgi:hypothetical protein
MNCPICGFIFNFEPLISGATYALHCNGVLSDQQLQAIRDHVKALGGLGVKIIVVEGGTELKEATQ